MVVQGQPKTAAEYIQATSRIGRDLERPGLVVAVLNLHKPRDRTHFEQFRTSIAASIAQWRRRVSHRGRQEPWIARWPLSLSPRRGTLIRLLPSIRLSR